MILRDSIIFHVHIITENYILSTGRFSSGQLVSYDLNIQKLHNFYFPFWLRFVNNYMDSSSFSLITFSHISISEELSINRKQNFSNLSCWVFL